jgi:indole-3-glycerol phosphate synthase
MNILQDIVRQKQREVEVLRVSQRDFVAALRQHPCSIIAEYKRASPSGGQLNMTLSVEAAGQLYAAGGAAAMSILTDQPFFQGELDFIRRARAVCSLPILRKDFIIDPLQVYQSKLAGADAILLIVRILTDEQLQTLSNTAHALNLQTLVEVHTAQELQRALSFAPDAIGVNTRNLDTLEIHLDLLTELRPLIPATICAVAESGVETPNDVATVRQLGYQAVLLGTALMTAPAPADLLKKFVAYGN